MRARVVFTKATVELDIATGDQLVAAYIFLRYYTEYISEINGTTPSKYLEELARLAKGTDSLVLLNSSSIGIAMETTKSLPPETIRVISVSDDGRYSVWKLLDVSSFSKALFILESKVQSLYRVNIYASNAIIQTPRDRDGTFEMADFPDINVDYVSGMRADSEDDEEQYLDYDDRDQEDLDPFWIPIMS
uniref:Uncharacterized protein n=1 Tax=viral metagenome TaxID=1070528 RepID=A0A6C0JWH3_9ZZZZ